MLFNRINALFGSHFEVVFLLYFSLECTYADMVILDPKKKKVDMVIRLGFIPFILKKTPKKWMDSLHVNYIYCLLE